MHVLYAHTMYLHVLCVRNENTGMFHLLGLFMMRVICRAKVTQGENDSWQQHDINNPDCSQSFFNVMCDLLKLPIGKEIDHLLSI